MKNNRRAGFSLMEMMVVLLIVAIVAAASAPMVSKKMSRNAGTGDSPWVFNGTSSSVAFNFSGDNNTSAVIGAVTAPANWGTSSNQPAKLHITSSGTIPQISLTNGSSTGAITYDSSGDINIAKKIVVNGNNVTIGNPNNDGIPQAGNVSIAGKVTIDGNNVSIGNPDNNGSMQAGNVSIAGKIVINGNDVTIAHPSNSGHINIANKIKYDRTLGGKEFTLGDRFDTVLIPGNLIVEGDVMLSGNDSFAHVYLRGQSGRIFMVDGFDAAAHEAYPELTIANEVDNASGTCTINGHTYNSDRRLKNVGEKFAGGLDELKKLEFFHYTFKKDETKTPQVGVIAQDLQKVFPTAVFEGNDGYLRIRLDEMFYAALNAIKELDAKVAVIMETLTSHTDQISKLQAKIDAQQKTIDAQDKAIADLTKRIEKLEKKSRKAE